MSWCWQSHTYTGGRTIGVIASSDDWATTVDRSRPRPCALMRDAPEHLIQRQQDLNHDQGDDGRLEPHTTTGVDDVGQCMSGFVDDAQLARQRHRALFELVFVDETRVEPLELRMVPEYVRLFLDLDTAGDAVLYQQRLADGAQHLAAVRWRAAPARELRGERLGHFEHLAHLALVARERHVLGERVGDDEQAWRRQVAHDDLSAGDDLVVLLGSDLDDRALVLGARIGRDDARAQAAQDLVLLDRRKPDEHDDPVAKQHRVTSVHAERERRRGDDVAALQHRRVEPVAEQQRPCGDPGSELGRRDGRALHNTHDTLAGARGRRVTLMCERWRLAGRQIAAKI